MYSYPIYASYWHATGLNAIRLKQAGALAHSVFPVTTLYCYPRSNLLNVRSYTTAEHKAGTPVMASSTGATTGGTGTFAFKSSMDTYAALEDQRRESPAAERNKQPILDVMRLYLLGNPGAAAAPGPAAAAAAAAGEGHAVGRRPLILEIASGSGQHVAHLAAALPQYDIQPSDVTTELYGSITAYAAGLTNVRLPPLLLDASAPDWPVNAALAVNAATAKAPKEDCTTDEQGGDGDGGGVCGLDAAAILCVNMCHIAPVEATQGLLMGAGTALRPRGGLLFIYGPFTRDGAHTAPSNAAFDASLRSRNPAWGYRDVGQVVAWATQAGLEHVAVHDMPANNFMLVFRRP
ncbi:hypothetical protein Agub_g14246 [Astrephomene gubernaculifera]|uniref:Uncharacterized protein n=1 Tax=Astrephomene gubernaculifera TaxID=47775 RepID=A0AAD3E379_9CHLO|nr:hypothetical protein Agub_g14246 [Astrephomene gubernaculifera]